MSSMVNCRHAYYQVLGFRSLDQSFRNQESELRFLRGQSFELTQRNLGIKVEDWIDGESKMGA